MVVSPASRGLHLVRTTLYVPDNSCLYLFLPPCLFLLPPFQSINGPGSPPRHCIFLNQSSLEPWCGYLRSHHSLHHSYLRTFYQQCFCSKCFLILPTLKYIITLYNKLYLEWWIMNYTWNGILTFFIVDLFLLFFSSNNSLD